MLFELDRLYGILKDQYVYQAAIEDYKRGIFTTVSAQRLDDGCIQVEGRFRIRFSYAKEDGRVTVRFKPGFMDSHAYCSCGWFMQSHICEHVGALLLMLNEIDLDSLPCVIHASPDDGYRHRAEIIEELTQRSHDRQNKQDTGAMIAEVKAELSTLAPASAGDKGDVRLYMYMDVDRQNRPAIGFKVGRDKLYVVRDLTRFLADVDHERHVSYGKALEFVHAADSFDRQSGQVMAAMRFLTAAAADAEQGTNGIWKMTAITPANIDRLYDTMAELDERHSSVICTTSDVPETVIATSRPDGDVEVTMTAAGQTVGTQGVYYVDADSRTICRSTSVVSPAAIRLVERLSRQTIMLVDAADLPAFARYIYQPTAGQLDWQGFDFSSLSPGEDKLILYGDIDGQGRLSFELECQYDDGRRAGGLADGNRQRSVLCEQIAATLIENGATAQPDGRTAVMAIDDERTARFLTDVLPVINEQIDVYVSDAVQNMGRNVSYGLKVGIGFEGSLLDFDVSSIDIPADELADVIRSYRRRSRFHRLNSGRLLSLQSDELAELDQMMDDYDIPLSALRKGRAKLPAYRALAIDGAAQGAGHIAISRSRSFSQLVAAIRDASSDPLVLPAGLDATLRDYQRFGVQWMHHLFSMNLNGILADDMGLGKTLEALALLQGMGRRPNLVVCPSSLILNWRDEVERFCPGMKALCVMGTADARGYLISQATEYDLLITSYDYMRRDGERYGGIGFFTVILDEAQYIKNQRTKNAASVKGLKAVHRLAMTGTPIENNLAELWSIFDFLMPGYLFSYARFRQRFERDIVSGQNPKAQQKLKSLVEPFILRRTKQQVLKELPDKQETTLQLEFSEQERRLYLANLALANKTMREQMALPHMDRIAILAQLTRLRQLCVEPRLLYSDIDMVGSKLAGCMELLSSLKQAGSRTLLFSSFTSALDLIARQCELMKISYLMLTGDTPKQRRHDMVEDFQQGGADVFLISLKAGGTGLNLTRAEAVIHYDPWWNLSAQNQATDRAYRIGQHNAVMVYKLVMKESIEEKIMALQSRKKELADLFVEGNQGSLMTMDAEEIVKLFEL